jgi:hypothetical protein
MSKFDIKNKLEVLLKEGACLGLPSIEVSVPKEDSEAVLEFMAEQMAVFPLVRIPIPSNPTVGFVYEEV